jgi:arylsulfatase A-like enzyme
VTPRVVTLALAALALAAPAIAHAAQPNVLLIVTDDQRWDTLQYMPTVQNKLQAKGVTFTNAFAVNPVCCPSRSSILTGRWSHSTGVWGINGAYGGFHVFDDSSALPTWLDAAGYTTMLAGKYLNGYWPPWAPATYVPPGWDRWFAYWGPGANRYFDYQLTDGLAAGWYGTEEADYATDVIAREAAQFIREAPDPFFLYFAPKAPHSSGSAFNVVPAPRHVDRFAGLSRWAAPSVNERDVADKPAYIRARGTVDEDKLAEFREEQLESLLAVDEAVAGMLAALKETGKLAETLIVFTSDNGHAWGEHRWFQKIVPYEEAIRVPLVIRWDRLGLAGSTDRRFALNVDLAPTIASAAGVPAPGAEGRSLLPAPAAQPASWRTSFLVEDYMAGSGVPAYCGFRGGRWKYVQYTTGEEELYNLSRDPYELRNVRAWRRPLVMGYRARVLASACRPPSFRPLPLCTRTGSPGPDRIRGSWRRDWICAGRGNDRIRVLGGRADVVRCGRGRDRVRADWRDRLIGCEQVTRT